MDKASFKKLIIWSAIAGVIIGVLQSVFNINLLTDYTVSFIIITVIVITVAATMLSINQWKIPMTLANKGKFEEAIQAFEKLHEKHKGKMGYKDQAIAGIANIYNRMGEFEKSNTYLDKMNFETLDNNLKSVSYAIYAHNLYFQDFDLYKALNYIKKSREIVDMPEFILLQALLEFDLNYKETAGELIKKYESLGFNKKYIGGFYTVLLIDEFSKKINENFMLGLYYYKLGEFSKARMYLEGAANCEYNNFFSSKARELLTEI